MVKFANLTWMFFFDVWNCEFEVLTHNSCLLLVLRLQLNLIMRVNVTYRIEVFRVRLRRMGLTIDEAEVFVFYF